MSSIIADNSTYNIVTENELTIVLSHFNDDFIFSMIHDKLMDRVKYFGTESGNVICAWENYFKNQAIIYPTETARIEETRFQTYKKAIEIMAEACNLKVNYDGIRDIFSTAMYLYDFLISKYSTCMVAFFTNFIIKEKNGIYEQLEMVNQKKNKDTTTLYNKKLFKNVKLAVITANLDYVVQNISCFDISFEDILNLIYPQPIVECISESVSPIGNFYNDNYLPILTTYLRPGIISNIALSINSISIQ